MIDSHVIDYEIFGDDLQYVEIELDPYETVIGEAGAMMFMQDGIDFKAMMGDGTNPAKGLFSKVASAGKRMMAGEGLFITHFTNQHPSKKARVAFAASTPGKIVPVDLGKFGDSLLCQQGAFLCAAYGTRISVGFTKKLRAGFFGGEGFVLQKLEGNGMAFLSVGGSIKPYRLENESIKVDTGCLVAMQSSLDHSIEMSGNLKSVMFGGEGMFLSTISGSGWVWLQSLPFDRLMQHIVANLPEDDK